MLVVALAVGGSSHVTDALEDGPVGLAEDLGRRVQLSVERRDRRLGSLRSWSSAGVVALIALAIRERRPLLLSLLAALAVSLIVNDSPNDVVIAGLVCYLVLSSAPGLARPARERERPAPRARQARTAPAVLALSTVIPWPARSKQTAPAFTRQ